MANSSDSFIDEVSEALRRDRLTRWIRRWGWVVGLVVLLIVGGAAYLEWRKHQNQLAAEARGDVLLDAVETGDAPTRAAAMTEVQLDGPAGALADLLAASEAQTAGDTDAALARLDAAATDPDADLLYRDLAAFKALTLRAGTVPEADLRTALEALAQPGAPFRLLAEEQIALSELREGDTAAAVARLQAIVEDAEVGQGLRDRANSLMVALGEAPEAAATQAEAAPETTDGQ